jgi:6-phosphogluconolactonase (cycloisomerase 2 family)/membrane-bound inhibitor of C-type lysozyme
MLITATYLSGCGGNTYGGSNTTPVTYTVSGTVSGHTGTVTLTNVGVNTQTVLTSGSNFSFPAQTYGSSWNVSATGPASQNCTVTSGNGSGTNITSNVTVQVACTTNTYIVSGTVTGHTGNVIFTNNNDVAHEQVVSASGGSFSFPAQNFGSSWNVVVTSPANQNCSITSLNGSGSSITSNVTMQVTCSAKSFTVSGTVTGNTDTVTLTNMGANPQAVSISGGHFNFPAQEYGSSWNVVAVGPSGQNCSVKAGIAGGTSITSNQSLVFQCSTTTFPVSGTISGNTGAVTLTNNGVDSIILPANATNFTFNTQIASGSSYSVTVANHPGGQICSVSNGSGNSISASVNNIIVACRTMHAYVVNNQDNTISQFSITNDGSLNAIGSVDVSTSAPSPVNITIDKTGQHAYVTSGTTDKIAQFSVGISGALTPLTPAFVSATGNPQIISPQSISIDPTGNYAYVTYNATGKVALFTISSGLLTETITPQVATGAGPWGVTTDPSGKFLYVANNETSTVSQFSIGMGGALSALSPATVVTGGASREAPYFISVDPTGKYAYVTNGNTYSLAQFSIDSSSGVLTPLSPSSVVTQGTPFNVKTDPTGRFVYVVNSFTGSISQYTVGSNGALSATRSTLPTSIHVFDIGIDPTGRYAYWTSEDDTVSQYKIDGSNGTLSQISAPLVLGDLGTKLPRGIAIY